MLEIVEKKKNYCNIFKGHVMKMERKEKSGAGGGGGGGVEMLSRTYMLQAGGHTVYKRGQRS